MKYSCDPTKIPSPPSNGYVVTETLQAYTNGTRNSVEFKCSMGFKLVGESLTTCIIDGYWTEPNVSCDRKLFTSTTTFNSKKILFQLLFAQHLDIEV